MAPDADTASDLMRAGAGALAVNSPRGAARAAELVDFVGTRADRVVDLGCGRGTLLLDLVARHTGATATGVDAAPGPIADATARALALGVAEQAMFLVGDAAGWTGEVDAALCIGSSHALGGSDAVPAHLARLVCAGSTAAVIGELVWAAEPPETLLERFGPLPTGLAPLVHGARRAGWTVDAAELSTPDEWDAFESGWVAGVRAVGTPHAARFADERWSAYQANRGVVGFGWLCLHRRA